MYHKTNLFMGVITLAITIAAAYWTYKDLQQVLNILHQIVN
jgi:hypothetical protein